MLSRLKSAWGTVPAVLRRWLGVALKAAITVSAFWLLFTKHVEVDGQSIPIGRAMLDHLGGIDPVVFWPWLLAATAIKFVGILASMVRWHLLLLGQGIRFNFGHLAGSFLIGRFLGTFLPGTVGLDSYKLYDAARHSKKVVEPAAATVVEKATGFSAIFLSFLVTAPLGYAVLGDAAGAVLGLTVPVACSILVALYLVLTRPGLVQWGLGLLPSFGRARLEHLVTRVSEAAAAYRGRGRLLLSVMALSFCVHFFTAVMYFFTAIAVGAAGANFWQVTFASSIQIFATVISPFTIAGEGIREIVQALLLSRHIGVSESILSAALGFWAAEAMTLVGGVIWWTRRGGYQPRLVEVDGATVDPSAATGGEDAKPTSMMMSA